ncbi:hypothetical protein LJB42_004388 [Komagataella kurtzmanii]|nr:hypothetical protein LJB42_004388 [Komagataella kurtzmanii]
MSNTETEDDVFEFLNSLPDDEKNLSADQLKGKSDQDILEFLDQLTEKEKESDTLYKPKEANAESDLKPLPKGEAGIKTDSEIESAPREGTAPADSQASRSWWGVNSLLQTAAQFTNTAQEKAEETIRKARESNEKLDLTSVKQFIEKNNLTTEQKDELLSLTDPNKAIDSLGKGFGFFSSKLSSVLDKITEEFVNTDEILDIKFIHDMINYEQLNELVRYNFERVMRSQVDGEIKILVTQTNPLHKESGKNLSLLYGKNSEGEKLATANIEEAIKKDQSQDHSHETEPKVRRSKIYVAIQGVSLNREAEDSGVIDTFTPGSFSFVIVLQDTTHNISITAKSQPFPLKWAHWLDGEKSLDTEVDPSEWVKTWVINGIDLAIGVVAQSYIIKRMGF